MSIRTYLNIAPYFDDFQSEKSFYRILFKPSVALQARELTQLQTILQNQIEEFGSHVFKEGSIVRGCSFTDLKDLPYVKVTDGINPTLYVDRTDYDSEGNPVEFYYELEGGSTGLKAYVVAAERGFQSRDPDLNTFYLRYLGSSTVGSVEYKTFQPLETISVREYKIVKQEVSGEIVETTIDNGIKAEINVSSLTNSTGYGYGVKVSSGVIFQSGYFLAVAEQTVILTKYKTAPIDGISQPDSLSVGFFVNEEIVTSQQDVSLLDNATASPNFTAPGADRLKLSPILVVKTNTEAKAEPSFFILRKYQNGSLILNRDISQYNTLGLEFAKRTSEESGDYAPNEFDYKIVRNSVTDYLSLKLGRGSAYIKGYRIENYSDSFFDINPITTKTAQGTKITPFNYGGYLETVGTASGLLPIGGVFDRVQLLNAAEAIIGYASVKNYISGKIYLFDVRLTSGSTAFTAVKFVKHGADVKIEVVPAFVDQLNNRLIFPLSEFGVSSVSNMFIPIRKRVTGLTISAGKITIPSVANETFTNLSLQDVLVISNGSRLVVTNVAIVSGNLEITTSTSSGSAAVFYNVLLSNITPKTKTKKTSFLRMAYSSATKKYSLGITDAIKLVSVKNAAGVDFTQSFELHSNQTDNYYDLSYIEYKAGMPVPAEGAILTIEFDWYQTSSSGRHIYTKNSYPTGHSPKFVGQSGTFLLGNCIDLRPHRKSTSVPADTVASAAVFTDVVVGIPSSASYNMFQDSTNIIVPADDTFGSIDLESYNSRIDSLVVDSYGNFVLVKGTESKLPVPPSVEGTLIANVKIPTNPAYSYLEASTLGLQDYAIKIENKIPKGYTMREISNLAKDVQDLKYYASLSLLEKKTNDMLITDADGLNRFKSGILVDTFENLDIADINNSEFLSSVDNLNASLVPMQEQIQMNLIPSVSNGVTLNDGKIATLSKTGTTVFIEQTKATGYRSCVLDFYQYTGKATISPEYDTHYDTINAPDIKIEVDLAGAFADFTRNLQEIIPLTNTQARTLTNSVVNGRTTTTTATTTTTTKALQSTTDVETKNVGSVVTDFRFEPFMASKILRVFITGLRPNTRHWPFFDGQLVSEHCALGFIGTDRIIENMVRITNYDSSLTTDNNGNLALLFRIPEGVFYVGDRNFEVLDISDYGSLEEASISNAKITYRAYNFDVTKANIISSVRTPDFSIKKVTTTRTVVTREVRPANNGSSDPLAQTFFVKTGGGQSNVVYLDKIDLYFKRKSNINGINIAIREVENGYPSYSILPFGAVNLQPSEVFVSDDSSRKTTVQFKVPVALQSEKEYALVLLPDGNDPDYLVYTSTVGGDDLLDNLPITQDWGDGVLFSSTNNRAWKSLQNEDLKFTLYRSNFSRDSGSYITLRNDNHEFFTIYGNSGIFSHNEEVYKQSADTKAINVTSGSSIISGDVTSYGIGDKILIVSASGSKMIATVKEIGLSTGISIKEVALFSGTNLLSRLVAVGRVNKYDPTKPAYLTLVESNANTKIKFNTNDIIYGIDSGVTATIVSVDNKKFSYILPMVNKTTETGTSISADLIYRNLGSLSDPQSTKRIDLDAKIYFEQDGIILYSKSNDLLGTNSIKLKLNIETSQQDNLGTPQIDVESASLFCFTYRITDSGATTSKYVSKTVVLEETFDAADLRVYVTAYRPYGSNIAVYAKIQSTDDPLDILQNSWIKLNKISKENVFSSNMSVPHELVYEFDKAIISAGSSGFDIVKYSNDVGAFEGFRKFKIRIDLLSDGVNTSPIVFDYRGIALR